MQVKEGQPNDLRPLFRGRQFIGTDMRAGAGVDRIEDLRERREAAELADALRAGRTVLPAAHRDAAVRLLERRVLVWRRTLAR